MDVKKKILYLKIRYILHNFEYFNQHMRFTQTVKQNLLNINNLINTSTDETSIIRLLKQIQISISNFDADKNQFNRINNILTDIILNMPPIINSELTLNTHQYDFFPNQKIY